MKIVRKGTNVNFLKALKTLKTKQISVGFFKNSTYPDGTPVAYVASIHEYGYPTGKIPARSFMKPTIKEKQSEWSKQMAGTIQGAIDRYGR